MTFARRWPVTATTLAASLVALALGWRGVDFPAQILRIERFREGELLWNGNWYGGHPTLGYSVLLPAVGALLGVTSLAVVTTTGSVAAFEALVRRHPRGRRAAGAFAIGMLANLVVGRLAFALGTAFALLALLVLARSPAAAAVLAAAAGLSSPLAGVFLAIGVAAWGLHHRRPGAATAVCAWAVGPAAAVSFLFGAGGSFPFGATTLVWTLALCAVVAAATDEPVVRIGCALYAAACLGAFTISSPLGANVGRLAMLVTAPLVLLADPARVRRIVLAVPVVVGWHTLQITQAASAVASDPSVEREYHEGVVEFLRGLPQPVRVEIPFTRNHWETAYVASEIPIARGWERQVDRELNPEFYDEERPLDAARYEAWLARNGVTHVALPDVPFDESSRREAELVRGGLPYLEPVYRDENWTVFVVRTSSGIVAGDAAVLEMDDDHVVVEVGAAGDTMLRVRESPLWYVAQGDACIDATADGWLRVSARAPGRIELRQRVDVLRVIEGDTDTCAGPPGDGG